MDLQHQASAQHIKKAQWYNALEESELDKQHQWMVQAMNDYFVKKAKAAKLRAQEVTASDATWKPEAAGDDTSHGHSKQAESYIGVQPATQLMRGGVGSSSASSSSRLEANEGQASGHDDDRQNDCLIRQTGDGNDDHCLMECKEQDDTSEAASDMTDIRLKEALDDLLRNPEDCVISIKGPQVWLPISCRLSTQNADLYAWAGITFALSSEAFTLFREQVMVPKEGIVKHWLDAPTCDLILVRKPHTPRPNISRRALPVLETLDLSSEATSDAKEDSEYTMEEERERMARCDHDILNAHVNASRTTTTLQVARCTQISQIAEQYARMKRASADRISPYVSVRESYVLEHDTEIWTVMKKPKRGGQCDIYIWKDEQWIEKQISEDTTADMLKWELDSSLLLLVYKGAVLAGDLKLAQLKGSTFHLSWNHPGPILRPREVCDSIRILTLAELMEWYADDGSDDAAFDNHGSAEMHIAWCRLVKSRKFQWYAASSGRGGGGKGRLPWTSTRTLPGLALATEVQADGTPLKQITGDEVCPEATGVAMMLLSSWPELKALENAEPLLILFPGHTAAVLKKLGASPGRIQELVLLYEEPSDKSLVKRNTTALALSNHKFAYGQNLQAVAWSPDAAIEYVIELDTKWSSPLIASSANQDFKALAAELVGKMARETVLQDQIYGIRHLRSGGEGWQARIRLNAEVDEKALCGSGLEGMFLRPS